MTRLTGVNLDDIRSRTKTVGEYLDSIQGKDKDAMLRIYEHYRPKEDVVDRLRRHVNDIVIVVFSAAWCKDCKNALPVLRHLEERIGLNVRVFGGIKTAPLDPNHQWRIPPSPPEMEEWEITHIPWIVIFDLEGNEIGTVIEKPTVTASLEEEILYHLERPKTDS